MPMIDFLKRDLGNITPLLEAGEQPMVMTGFDLAGGTSEIGAAPSGPEPQAPPPAQPSAADRLGKVLDGQWIADKINWNVGWERVLGGVNASGGVGSAAGKLVRLAASKREGLRYCLVTDRRMMVVESKGTSRAEPYRCLFAVPRGAIGAARVQARGRSRGRVVIAFTDGSVIALHTGMFAATAARQLAAALQPGAVPAG